MKCAYNDVGNEVTLIKLFSPPRRPPSEES